MKKLLALSVIFLFIGVAVAPSINFTVVKASNDNDLVEVTTQACGINGYGNTTVKLTREQYQNLEQYLVEFRARLNQTSTRAEAVPLFKEAVVELNRYGLLPKGMSVEKAQKLVIGKKLNPIDKFVEKHLDIGSDNTLINAFCLLLFQIDSAFLIFQFPLLFLLGKGTGLGELFPNFFDFIFFLMFFYSLLPFTISIFSGVLILQLQGSINSLGILGKVYYESGFNGDALLLLLGFIGLKIGVYSSYYSLSFKGFMIGWSGGIYTA